MKTLQKFIISILLSVTLCTSIQATDRKILYEIGIHSNRTPYVMVNGNHVKVRSIYVKELRRYLPLEITSRNNLWVTAIRSARNSPFIPVNYLVYDPVHRWTLPEGEIFPITVVQDPSTSRIEFYIQTNNDVSQISEVFVPRLNRVCALVPSCTRSQQPVFYAAYLIAIPPDNHSELVIASAVYWDNNHGWTLV